MSAAVMVKTLRESWWLLLGVPVVIVCFEPLFVTAIGQFPPDALEIVQTPFVKRILAMLLGEELAAGFSATAIATLGFAHPFVYASTWALLLTVCTGMTAGEIDRGTADLLLTLPLRRATVFCSASLVWVLAGIPVSVAPYVGLMLGEALNPLWEPIDFGAYPLVCVNLFALYLAVGGVATLVGSVVSRRGTAVALVLAWLLGAFVLDFFATLWPGAERVAFIGPLDSYKPLPVVRSAELPWRDLGVLLGLAVASWGLGLWRYCRRDIPAT